jgi:CheY-like chemotaxis protein
MDDFSKFCERGTILIVDDDPTNLEILSEALDGEDSCDFSHRLVQ